MKALVKSKAEVGIWMDDVPEPTPGHNDVVIKIHKTAICGTDVHIYNWDDWASRTSFLKYGSQSFWTAASESLSLRRRWQIHSLTLQSEHIADFTTRRFRGRNQATRPGLEPGITEPEFVELPLPHRSTACLRLAVNYHMVAKTSSRRIPVFFATK